VNRGRERSVGTPDVQERILDSVEEIRVSAWYKERQNTMLRKQVLHEQLLKPYHLQGAQGLKPADCTWWDISCRWFVKQCAEPPFLLPVRFSHETGFDKDGIINLYNHHQWVYSSLDTSNSSASVSGQVLLLAVW
jgi:hypothetical protein